MTRLTVVGDQAAAVVERDGRVSVARALLDQYAPIAQGGQDIPEMAALADDPRYVIGRLQQALTALLSAELPPVDAQSSLLAQALADALEYRRFARAATCRRCERELCADHAGDWELAERYDMLVNALGLTTERPSSRTRLTAVE